MVFFRIKKVKGKEYAYLVENKWKQGSRQKVKGYLGRVHRFDKAKSDDFLEFKGIENVSEYVKTSENKKIISDILDWEFFKHGIDNKDFSVNLEDFSVTSKGKNVCIKINEGYLCSRTLKGLVEFKAKVDEDIRELSFRLGRAFVEAGVEVPEEVFIGLFEKVKGKEDLSAFEGFYY